MPFQINSSKLFITYPQCDVSKEDVSSYLTEKFHPCEILVAHELHANGDHHIHAFLSFKEPFRTKDAKFADLPSGHHGNYQGCRSAKNVLKYCTKEEDYVANFNVEERLAKRSTREEDFRSLLLGKRSLEDLVTENPKYLAGYCRLKLDYITFKNDITVAKKALPLFIPNPWGRVLRSCCNKKRRHYWLYSDKPNVGKTYLFAKPLVEEYEGHLRSGSEPYWDITGREKFVILDEYNEAIFRYFQLNSMCDGTYGYRIFMGGIKRLDNPLLIVLSNKSIQDIYCNKFDLLYARFNEIKLD